MHDTSPNKSNTADRTRFPQHTPHTELQPASDTNESYEVPAQSVEILQGMGVDISNPAEVSRFAATISVSGCPYPAPEMLFAYDSQRPDFSSKIVDVIDQQRTRRQALEDQRLARHENRLDRAQANARNLSYFGLVLGAGASLLHVSNSLCITIVLISVGGPNAATVLSRVIDRLKS